MSTLSIPEIANDTDALSAALAYAAAGWYVLPVKRGTKHPGTVVGNHWQQKSSRDPELIVAWFAGTDHGIALHCGRSGAVVFDVDDPDKLPDVLRKHLSTAPYQSTRPDTPERGHYIFTQPPGRLIGNGTGRLGGAWGEVRGLNGVIIVAPTLHPDGGRYSWQVVGVVPVLPDELGEQLDDSSPGEEAATDKQITAFLAEHRDAQRPEILAAWTSTLTKKIKANESRHNSLVSVLTGAAEEARAGFFRAQDAVDVLKPIFIDAVLQPPKPRTPQVADHEFKDILAWAVAQANAADLDKVRARVAENVPDPDNTHWPISGTNGQGSIPKPKPGSFFAKGVGLLALDVANAVMDHLACAYNPQTQRFYCYSNGVWRPDQPRIEEQIGDLLGNRYRKTYSATILDLIKFSDRTPRVTCEPQEPFINTLNGMVFWRTGTALPHASSYLSTVQLPVEYHSDATCPAFDAFLNQVVPPDCIELVWEVIAYMLYSGNPLHAAVLLYGKGRNGKGTLIRVLKTLLGETNCSCVGLHELTENRFRSATLFGKLANLAGDLDAKWIANTAAFKGITGGDHIQGEYKFGAAFDFTPWATPVYSANKAFGSADSSEGWVSRWTIIPFPNTFGTGERDIGLDAKLHTSAELQGVLTHGIRVLPGLLERGYFVVPRSAEDAKKAFVAASDAIRAWVGEACDVSDPDAWEVRQHLYHAYREHSVMDGSKTLSAREFYQRIEQISGIVATKRDGERGFRGLQLTNQGAPGRAGSDQTCPSDKTWWDQ